MKLFSFFKKPNKQTAYKCSCCGQIYDQVPLCFGAAFPDYYFSIPPAEKEKRIELQPSLCVIDEELFFHRCRLTIPIIDNTEDLVFDVWTTISQDNFDIRIDLWEDPERITQEPYFGWLQTIVPTYGDTLNIRAVAMEQPVGFIPEVKIVEENHPLKTDQENGITYQKALEIVDKILREQHQQH